MADYGPLYSTAGNQWGVDPLLLQSMAHEESAEDPNAVGPVIQSGPAAGQRALGFMQFLPQTAKQYSVDTSDATSSVFGAGNYMADLLYKQNLPLRQALATYGGTAGNPNSGYVNDVMTRYKALKSAWTANEPPPTTDTDPDSPTAGAPTTRNLKIPSDLTTAKGNAGQPAPSVPTTDSGPGVSISAPGLQPPEQGGPKGQRQGAAPAPSQPSSIADIKPTHNSDGTPIAEQPTPGTPAPKSAIADIPVTHNNDGTPIVTMDTGEYLTSATSPGAKSVGSSAQIAEGREPGPAVQAAINVATDPGQRARIAASQLNIPLDRIVIGQGNRLAAVDEQGQRYYIDPPPVFADQGGITKVPGAFADVTAAPDWHPIGAAQVTPYSRAAPALGPGATAQNIPLAMGAAIPNTVQNYLTWAPAGLGGAVAGPVGVGVASAGTTAARNMLANYLDPDQSQHVPILTGEDTRQALINAGLTLGGRFLGGQFEQGLNRPMESPGVFGGQYDPYLSTHTQFPAPRPGGWSPVGLYRGREPMPVGPSVPIEARPLEPGMVVNDAQRSRRLIEGPGAAPGGFIADPFEGAAEATGPYAATSAQEAAAQPTTMPAMRMPPTSEAAQNARADEVIRHFAAMGNKTPDATELITKPSLAQSTGNSGLAALERSMAANTPEGQTLFQNFRDAQLEARRNFTRNLVGTPQDLAALKAARETSTSQAKAAAFGPGQTTPVSAQPVIDKIDEILRSPEGVKQQVGEPLRQIRSWLYEKDPITQAPLLDQSGAPILMTDPERLYSVRQDIANAKIGPMSTAARTDARGASHVLGEVENTLDNTISGGAPNYPAYMQQYREQSGPINAMQFLQGRNLTDAFGDTTLTKVNSAIREAENQRLLKPGARPADALTDDQMNQLYMLRDDLRRQANTRKGMDIGSPTAQNLATAQVYNVLTSNAARLARTAALGGLGIHESGNLFGALVGPMSEHYVENFLTNRAANAELGVRLKVIQRLLNQDQSGTRALAGVQPGAAP